VPAPAGVPATAAVPAPAAAPASAAAQEADGAAPRALARRPDERRSDDPLTVNLFGRPTELGVSYEISAERRGNFDLNGGEQRDRDVLDHELKLDARMRLGERFTLFAQMVGLADQRKDRGDSSVQRTHALERGQMWLLADEVAGLPLAVQLGRVALIDRRSWWWDDDLDALRVIVDQRDWRLETGLAREVARVSSSASGIDPVSRGVTRWFGNGAWRWAERHSAEVFWLLANDSSGAPAPGRLFEPDTEDASDAHLRWLGLRTSGEVRFESKHRFLYRADLALLRGRETATPFDETDAGPLRAGTSSTRRVRASAWDIGAQWRLPGDARPTFSIGLANGSGGSADGTVDHNFRQTGLQENKGRVGGVKRWRYYGELLDPELSNLRIASVGFGLRMLNNSSAEVLLHRYRQRVASPVLAGARLSEDPQGTNRDIGQEVDLLFAMREWRHVELTLKLSRFKPGAAFAADKRDAAHAVELGATFTF
jgi:alginate production protein